MKRKKWSELEEQTLLTKYSDLVTSGTLAKLKTREKKFKPIADHVNSIYHLQDPINYPFKWSWRDVSIKVQNMRHQYLGVKQKIKISNNEFNWKDGEDHWENFLMYKQVFGDVELSEAKDHKQISNAQSNYSRRLGEDSGGDEIFGDEGVMELGYGMDSEEFEEEEEEKDEMFDDEVGVSEGEFGGDREKTEEGKSSGISQGKKMRKGSGGRRLKMVGGQVIKLQDIMLRREEKRRESEWSREDGVIKNHYQREEREFQKEMQDNERNEEAKVRELEYGDKQIMWAKREYEWRIKMEKEFDEEKKRRMQLEEKWENEEMEWREKMVGMQIEHEKQMMQLHTDACQNQMQVLGVVARVLCQFFGSMNDGLAGSLGTLPPQVLQNLHHPGSLGENGKPDTNSPSEFL